MKNIRKVSQKDFYRLCELVREHYIARNETDIAFAKWATEQMGVDIPAATVSTARDVFGIPSWKEAKAAASPPNPDLTALETRLTAQEDANGRMHNRVHSLEDEVRRLKEVVKDMTYTLDKVQEHHRKMA